MVWTVLHLTCYSCKVLTVYHLMWYCGVHSACMIQVEASCERLCQALGGEVHRLALQVQVLEQSDTLAIEAAEVRPAV